VIFISEKGYSPVPLFQRALSVFQVTFSSHSKEARTRNIFADVLHIIQRIVYHPMDDFLSHQIEQEHRGNILERAIA
jgi:hypothetical protein